MYPKVASKVCHLNELPVAVNAVVRLLSCVKGCMGLEVVISGKTLVTLFALERLFPGVSPFMVLRNMFVSKAPAVYFTREHTVWTRG